MTKIGCHVSIADGIENAPERAKKLEAECFQVFSRSPHGGNYKTIDEQRAKRFLANCKKFGFAAGKDYVIHTPYFINLASANNRIYYGSISTIRKELETATLLQSPFVITHIGSSKDLKGKDVAKQINKKVMHGLQKIHDNYSGSAMLLLEIAAGSGNIIGDSFEEIGYFIETAKKENIELGFCFDTCHSFAAGYDLRTPAKTNNVFKELDQKIGLKKLKCIHFNDSLTAFNSRKDRHEHIGKGQIGKQGLKAVFDWAQKLELNLYLETKHDKIEDDLKITKNWRK
jgi:deoxyribonuclease IV